MFIQTIGILSGLLLLAGVIVGTVGLLYYSRKKIEEKRIDEIVAHLEEWGQEMCDWLIAKGFHATEKRVADIMSWYDFFGAETCQNLIQGTITVGMTDKMVLLSLGQPTRVDNQATSVRGERFRWVYGLSYQRTAYIWFTAGKVTKMKNLYPNRHLYSSSQRPVWLFDSEENQKTRPLRISSKRTSHHTRPGFLTNLERVKKMHIRRGDRS